MEGKISLCSEKMSIAEIENNKLKALSYQLSEQLRH